MKPIFIILAVGFSLISCSADYQEPDETLETLPVTSVEMPAKYAKDSITEIPVKYIRPTVCHSFYDFYYLRDNLTRTVAVISLKVRGSSCPSSQTESVETLKFQPAALGTYHFKFWKGTNNAGVDEYIEYDAVVNH